MQVKSNAECSKRAREHSAIFSTFIKLPFVFMTFVLSIFEWTLQTGFTIRFCVNKIIKRNDSKWNMRPQSGIHIKKGKSCPVESGHICDRRLSLHQQYHCHDRELVHNDVPYCTCHGHDGSYTSLSTPSAIRCCYKRPPVQVQSPILQD